MRRQKTINVLVMLLALSLWVQVDAKEKYFTLVEKTRAAQLILIGEITELRSVSVVVRVDQILKGVLVNPKIEVLWDRKGTLELPPANHQLGDPILLFANSKRDVYEPFAASQGTLKLQPGWTEQYQSAIQRILD